jgi:predicted lipoprotein with Yx(FWY)xxD motif
MRPLLLLAVLAAAAALGTQALAAQRRDATPAIAWKTAKLGLILTTKQHLALYTWRREAKGTVRCTGACAKAWPPLLVPRGTMLAKHVMHVMGTFGTIRRPDGRTQVTIDGHPLYTFADDSPTKILCNGVDGWYVRKA